MRALKRRRGVTLLEMLVVVVLLGAVGITIAAAVGGSARAAMRAVRHTGQRRSAVAVETLLRHDLADALDGDIVLESPMAFRYPRPVGAGAGCRTAGATITIADDDWEGGRLPVPGRDSAWVLDANADRWTTAVVLSAGASSCPDGRPAIQLTIGQQVLHPVIRVTEPVRVAVYRSGSDDWLGLAQVGAATIQPFAGPVVPAGAAWQLVPGQFAASLPFAGVPFATNMQFSLPAP